MLRDVYQQLLSGAISRRQFLIKLAPFGLTSATPAQPAGGVVTCNNTSDPLRHNPLNTQGHRDNSDSNFRLQFDHSFSFADLYYLAAFRSHERDYLDDNDGTAIIANGIAADGSIVEKTQSDTCTMKFDCNLPVTARFSGLRAFITWKKKLMACSRSFSPEIHRVMPGWRPGR